MKKKISYAICMCMVISTYSMTVCAAGTDDISSGFDAIYSIIAAIVSAIGSLFLLWGVFEWTQSMNTQDGAAQSMAFKRIASGLVAILTPQLIPIIQNAIS